MTTPPAADPATPVRLSLAPIGGAPFSLDASLATVGVVDGDLLALQPVPAGPAAPGIVEDIADAAVIFSASRLKPWAPRTSSAERSLASPDCSGWQLVSVSLTVWLPVRRSGCSRSPHCFADRDRGLAVRSPRAGAALSAAALVPITAALVLAVPGSFGAAQVTLAAAGITAWSLISSDPPAS